jgi:CheY-like chemotaxis protein
MPEMDGTEVAEQIMEDPDVEGVPIVFLTSIINEKEVESHRGLIGGRRFLSKASSAQSIIESVDRILAP